MASVGLASTERAQVDDRENSLLIVLYAVDFDASIHSRYPEILHFPERGLFNLSRLIEDSTEVFFLVNEPIHPAVIEYYLRCVLLLDEDAAADARNRLHIRVPRDVHAAGLSESVIKDTELRRELESKACSATAVELTVYGADQNTDKLAQALGVQPSEGPSQAAASWGSKSGSNRAFKRAGVAAPLTVERPIHTQEELMGAAEELYAQGVGDLIVKIDSSNFGSGIGNIVLAQRMFRSNAGRSELNATLEANEFTAHMKLHGVVVQQLIPNPRLNIGVFGRVGFSGELWTGPCYEQTNPESNFGGAIAGHLGPELCSNVTAAALKIGAVLRAEGYTGVFGVDFIEDSNGDLLALEVNVRKVGSYHPFAFATLALSAPNGTPHVVDGEAFAGSILMFRQMSVGSKSLTSIERLLRAFELSGLLFSTSTNRGAILHIIGAVPSFRCLEVTCVGLTVADTTQQLNEMQSFLNGELVSSTRTSALSYPGL